MHKDSVQRDEILFLHRLSRTTGGRQHGLCRDRTVYATIARTDTLALVALNGIISRGRLSLSQDDTNVREATYC